MTYSARSRPIAVGSGFIVSSPARLVCEQCGARIVVERLRQRFDGLTLLWLQLFGYLHVDRDAQVATGFAVVGGNTATSHAQHLARWRSRRDAHGDLAVERRHLHVGTER